MDEKSNHKKFFKNGAQIELLKKEALKCPKKDVFFVENMFILRIIL